MRDPCPRCGAARPSVGACPECGFEPEHPGVLASYARSVGILARTPRLLAVFLVPVLVLFLVQGLLFYVGGDVAREGLTLAGAVAGTSGLFLQVTWYLLAVALAVPIVVEEDASWRPTGSMVRGAMAGAGLITLPWALIAAVLVVEPEGSWGAVGLLSAVFLVVGSLFAAGRAVGMPVEGALRGGSGASVVRGGSRRGRENGGLGLVFLAVCMFALVPLSLGIASAVGVIELGAGLLMPVWGVTAWVLGSWIGVALVVGLVGKDPEAESTFECPACGREAVAKRGRARCRCGLEGAFYEGDPASTPS